MATRKRPRRRREERLPQYEAPVYRQLQRRLAVNVLRARQNAGITQEEAAHRCEMSTRLYQRVESREANLTLATIARICTGLDVDAAELFRT